MPSRSGKVLLLYMMLLHRRRASQTKSEDKALSMADDEVLTEPGGDHLPAAGPAALPLSKQQNVVDLTSDIPPQQQRRFHTIAPAPSSRAPAASLAPSDNGSRRREQDQSATLASTARRRRRSSGRGAPLTESQTLVLLEVAKELFDHNYRLRRVSAYWEAVSIHLEVNGGRYYSAGSCKRRCEHLMELRGCELEAPASVTARGSGAWRNPDMNLAIEALIAKFDAFEKKRFEEARRHEALADDRRKFLFQPPMSHARDGRPWKRRRVAETAAAELNLEDIELSSLSGESVNERDDDGRADNSEPAVAAVTPVTPVARRARTVYARPSPPPPPPPRTPSGRVPVRETPPGFAGRVEADVPDRIKGSHEVLMDMQREQVKHIALQNEYMTRMIDMFRAEEKARSDHMMMMMHLIERIVPPRPRPVSSCWSTSWN